MSAGSSGWGWLTPVHNPDDGKAERETHTGGQHRSRPAFEPQALIAIGLDGAVPQQLARSDGERAFYPVSAAPDGTSVVYWMVDETEMLPSVSYWKAGIDGSSSEQLSDAVSEAYRGPGVAWYGGGGAVLVGEMTVPYLERHDVVWSRGNAATTMIVAVDDAGQRTRLLASFSVGDRVLGWVSDEAMPERAGGQPGEEVMFADPVPVAGVPDGTRLSNGSAASLDGRYLTLEETRSDRPWSGKRPATKRSGSAARSRTRSGCRRPTGF